MIEMDTNTVPEKELFDGTSTAITWESLTVTTEHAWMVAAPITILNNVSGSIASGLNCIMGASGSGKTTFLSALACRVDRTRMTVSYSQMRINGATYTKNMFKQVLFTEITLSIDV
jgi:ABC-type multidrug transport system ATPase subunit